MKMTDIDKYKTLKTPCLIFDGQNLRRLLGRITMRYGVEEYIQKSVW